MKFTAYIDYVENIERAGKLTLSSDRDNTILSKVPIAIPDFLFNNPVFDIIHSTKAVKVVLDDELLSFDDNKNYRNSFEDLVEKNSQHLFIKGLGRVLFYPSSDQKLENDEFAFVMHKNDFKILFDTVSDKKNQVVIQTDKVNFLWFPEKVIHAKNNINDLLSNFENVEQVLKNKKDDQDRINELEAAQKKAKVHINNKPKLSDAIKKISSIIDKESDVKFNNSYENNSKGQKVIQAIPKKVTTSSYRNDELDALDVLLMYNNPELAPFMRPNSPLAWFMYFNNRTNDINKSYIEENIQNIQGFEDVFSTDFRYTSRGYTVNLLDSTGSNSIGKVEFNGQKNCYDFSSNNGEKTQLLVGENGQLQSCFISSNGNRTDMNLVQTKDGFVGNWNNNSDGIVVNSSVCFDNDLSYTSTPNNSIDLSKIKPYSPNESINFNNVVNNIDSSYDKNYDTPPPPPPSLENDNVWSSNDPYSNSNSFKF